MIPTQDDIVAALQRGGTQVAGNDPDRRDPPPLPILPNWSPGHGMRPDLVPARPFNGTPINPHLPPPTGPMPQGALPAVPPPPFKMAGDVVPFPISPQVSGARIANQHNMWKDYENRYGIPAVSEYVKQLPHAKILKGPGYTE